jgi:hypothetical protein
MAVLSYLYCHSCHFMALLERLSTVSSLGYTPMAVFFCLYCHEGLVIAVLPWQPCRGCQYRSPVLVLPPRFSGYSVTAGLSSLSCHDFPFRAVLSWFSCLDCCPCRSCSSCFILDALSRLYCHCFPVTSNINDIRRL